MYFNKHLGIGMCPNHWTYKDSSKVFNSVAEGRAAMKVYRLKNVEIERCK
jgi:hypothetical protein